MASLVTRATKRASVARVSRRAADTASVLPGPSTGPQSNPWTAS